MEQKNNRLPVPIQNQLMYVGKQLETTQKLLAESKRKRIFELALRRPDFFIEMLCLWYPLPEYLIDKYLDKWAWGHLSRSESLSWSSELIGKYKHKWTSATSRNKVLPWSLEFIEKHKDIWSCRCLSENASLPWSKELIIKYIDKWDYENICCNEKTIALESIIDCILNFSTENVPDRIINLLSRNMTIRDNYGDPTFDMLNSYKKYISEDYFELKWKTANLYYDYIDYEQFYFFHYIIFPNFPKSKIQTYPLLEKYKDKWDWEELSRNESLPWSEELIEKFKTKWTWKKIFDGESDVWSEPSLSSNEAIPSG